MEHLDLRRARRPALICAPHSSGRGKAVGFGNFVRQVEECIRLAAQLDVPLYLVRPARPLNEALFELASPDVDIVGDGDPRAHSLRRAWRLSPPIRYGSPLVWISAGISERLRPLVHTAMRSTRQRGWLRASRGLDRLEKQLRIRAGARERRVREAWAALLAEGRERVRQRPGKRQPRRIHMEPDAERQAVALARQAGIDLDRPLVTLHVRESGYRRQPGFRQREADAARDAHIDRYRPAVDWLAGQGIQVVRIGDASMSRCEWPGVIDVATAPWRTDGVELWAVLRSRFFIASDSGPYFLAHLAGVPCLAVNVIQVGYYTLRPRDRYICKHAFDLARGRYLTVAEMLTEEFVQHALAFDRYRWDENQAVDILEAVQDYAAVLDRSAERRTAEQQRHDELIRALAGRWKPSWKSGGGLLFRTPGRGTISAPFAAKYLNENGGPFP
jgi:putative glycosyltransferase (TIGR04372 family)